MGGFEVGGRPGVGLAALATRAAADVTRRRQTKRLLEGLIAALLVQGQQIDGFLASNALAGRREQQLVLHVVLTEIIS